MTDLYYIVSCDCDDSTASGGAHLIQVPDHPENLDVPDLLQDETVVCLHCGRLAVAERLTREEWEDITGTASDE